MAWLLLVGVIAYTRFADASDSAASREQIVLSGRAVSVAGCNRDFRTTQALRAVLHSGQRFQRAALSRKDITPAQYQRATAFYREQLARLPLPDCRIAESLLTDDPKRPVKVPTPLWH